MYHAWPKGLLANVIIANYNINIISISLAAYTVLVTQNVGMSVWKDILRRSAFWAYLLYFPEHLTLTLSKFDFIANVA